jgi:hypothetical protein
MDKTIYKVLLLIVLEINITIDMSNADDIFSQIIEEFESSNDLREWAKAKKLLQDPVVIARLIFLESSNDPSKRRDLASTDVLFLNILSEFKYPEELRKWANEMNLSQNEMVLAKIEYMEGLKRKIGAFTDKQKLNKWVESNNMQNNPMVNERLLKMGSDQLKECFKCNKKYSVRYFNNHACRENCNVRCKKCNTIFESRKLFYSHVMNVHHKGGAELQDTPFDVPPWEDGQGNVVDEELKEVYETHKSLILDTHLFGEMTSIYNFPINNDFDTQTLLRQVREIYDRENQVIKLNMIFGIILKNKETNEYRFFKPYKNSEVFVKSLQIADATDIGTFHGLVSQLNFNDYILRQRPDSKWIPVLVTQVRYWVNKTNFPMGSTVEIPDYLKNKKCLITLTSNYKGKVVYKDNLCIFRCYTYHKHPLFYVNDPKQFEQKVKENLAEYKKFIQTTEFKGFFAKDIDKFEECFEVNVNIFIIDENEVVIPKFKSLNRYFNTINLNLFENHLSYITNMDTYSKKFKCIKCQKLFGGQSNLKRHATTCSDATKYVYPGGFFSVNKNIFDELEEIGVHVDEIDRLYKWFIVFDFEALLVKPNIKSTNKLTWSHRHHPISVSVCSNIDGFTKPKCFVNTDTDELLKSMVDYMYLISDSAYNLAREKWKNVFEILDITEEQPLSKRRKISVESEESEDSYEKYMTFVREKIGKKFDEYCRQIPVLGFHSSKYDIPLIREKLAKIFNLNEGAYVIKRFNSYISITQKKTKNFGYYQFFGGRL